MKINSTSCQGPRGLWCSQTLRWVHACSSRRWWIIWINALSLTWILSSLLEGSLHVEKAERLEWDEQGSQTTPDQGRSLSSHISPHYCPSVALNQTNTIHDIIYILLFLFYMLSLSPAGELRRLHSDCSWRWGRAIPEGGWQKDLETSLLHAQGLRPVLRAQRKDEGLAHWAMDTQRVVYVDTSELCLWRQPPPTYMTWRQFSSWRGSKMNPVLHERFSTFFCFVLLHPAVIQRPRLLPPLWQSQHLHHHKLQTEVQSSHRLLLRPQGNLYKRDEQSSEEGKGSTAQWEWMVDFPTRQAPPQHCHRCLASCLCLNKDVLSTWGPPAVMLTGHIPHRVVDADFRLLVAFNHMTWSNLKPKAFLNTRLK